MARVIKTITENYTVLDADDGGIIIGNSSSAIAITMPSAIGRATFSLTVMNANSGIVTVLSQSIAANEGISIANSNNAWTFALGGGGGAASTLAGLTDVSISSPYNLQLLGYDLTESKWVNYSVISTESGIYVDSVNGNDSNDGKTPETALQTLLELFSRLTSSLVAGSPVNVLLAGSFTQSIFTLSEYYKDITFDRINSATPVTITELSILGNNLHVSLSNISIDTFTASAYNSTFYAEDCSFVSVSALNTSTVFLESCTVNNISGTAINCRSGNIYFKDSSISGNPNSITVTLGGNVSNGGGNTITGSTSATTGGLYRT